MAEQQITLTEARGILGALVKQMNAAQRLGAALDVAVEHEKAEAALATSIQELNNKRMEAETKHKAFLADLSVQRKQAEDGLAALVNMINEKRTKMEHDLHRTQGDHDLKLKQLASSVEKAEKDTAAALAAFKSKRDASEREFQDIVNERKMQLNEMNMKIGAAKAELERMRNALVI